MPSLIADIRLVAFTSLGREARIYPPAALAAYEFLTLVRGLPLDEAEIETPVGIFKVARGGNDGKCEIILPKCKQLSTNSPIIINNTTIFVSTLRTDLGIIRVYKCEDIDALNDGILPSICASSDGENIRGALAYSQVGGTARVKSYFLEEGTRSEGFVAAYAVACLAVGFKHSESPLKITLAKNDFFARRVALGISLSSPFVRPLILAFRQDP